MIIAVQIKTNIIGLYFVGRYRNRPTLFCTSKLCLWNAAFRWRWWI